MISMLRNWKGAVCIDSTTYNSINDVENSVIKALNKDSVIKLLSSNAKELESSKNDIKLANNKLYKIKVRQYMTKKATMSFDFMSKWNNDIPMPMRIMVGTKERETARMVYMKLHADITAKVTPCCMKCGRAIPNKISQFFGMGPECGGHNYTNPFSSDEELNKAVGEYRTKLQQITWEGWIIKSAIESEEEL